MHPVKDPSYQQILELYQSAKQSPEVLEQVRAMACSEDVCLRCMVLTFIEVDRKKS